MRVPAVTRSVHVQARFFPYAANGLRPCLYRCAGKYDEAEPLYRRALAIKEKALGPQHPNTATSINNLAELLRSQGASEHPAADALP